MRTINLIVVHCTASRCTATLSPEQLTREHLRRGFTECGYHYYVTRDGELHPMRDVAQPGAHALGYNANSIGVAYEGGLTADGSTADTRTPEQRQALRALLRHLVSVHPAARICGHRDLSPDRNGNGLIEPSEYIKICPCFDASTEYRELTKHR